MTEPARFAPNEWRRLSPWSIVHFAARAIFANVQASIAFLGGTTYGVSRSQLDQFTWFIPLGIIVFVLIGSVVTYYFYSYRVLDDSVQVRRGALFKKNLNLSFGRIQNVSLEHPFYFRPFGRVTLKVDGAGSKGEEVLVPALKVPYAEAVRDFVVARKRGASADDALAPASSADGEGVGEMAVTGRQAYFTRSLSDLVIHGLSNNRSFIAIAGILGFVAQSDISPNQIAARLGIDFDLIVAGLSIVRLVLLFVLSMILAVGVIALLSVLVAIVTYYGFTMYRGGDGLTIERGLFTRHEIHVQKSRIQTILLRQDWLDFLLGRRNVILERISHSQRQGDPWAVMKKKIFVPSVRLEETAVVTDEVLPGVHVEDLPFTPVSKRYFYKHALIASAFYVLALAVTVLRLPEALNWLAIVLLVLWPLHVFHRYMSWRRAGIVIRGDIVVARSGAIGIDYHLFPAYKAQDVSHIQSVLMKRHDLSSLMFHTASTTIRVPYLKTDFAKSVVDYCAFSVESTAKSWM